MSWICLSARRKLLVWRYFPQDSTENYGNLIRGPLGIHRKSGQRYPLAELLTLQPVEPLSVGGQLAIWDAWPKASPGEIEAASQEFPDHRQSPALRQVRRDAADIRSLDILEWAEQVTVLQPKRAHYVGLCPFHQEKTPSFTVYPYSQPKPSFFCYGCERWGDAADLKAHATGRNVADVLKEVRVCA